MKKSREAQTKDDCINAKQSAPNPSVVPLEKDIELQTLATMDEKERKVEENDKRREKEGTQDGNNTPRSPYVSPRKYQVLLSTLCVCVCVCVRERERERGRDFINEMCVIEISIILINKSKT